MTLAGVQIELELMEVPPKLISSGISNAEMST
jgi:hypothetical protein